MKPLEDDLGLLGSPPPKPEPSLRIGQPTPVIQPETTTLIPETETAIPETTPPVQETNPVIAETLVRPLPDPTNAGLIEDDLGLLDSPKGLSVARAAAALPAGFNEGLATLLGLPVDAVNAGLKKYIEFDPTLRMAGVRPEDFTSDEPLGGSASVRKLMQTMGIPHFEPKTIVERVLKRIGEEIGASVPAVGATLMAAKLGKTGSRFFGEIVKQFQKVPGKSAALEVTQAGAGGTGAAVVREIVPEDSPLRPTAEMLGQVGGGLSGAGTGRMAAATGRKIQEKVPFGAAARRRKVRQALVESATESPEEIARRLKVNAPEIEKTIDVKPTTAQAAEDRGLLTLERAAAKKGSAVGGELEDVIKEERRGVRRTLEKVIPEGRGEAVAETLDDQITQAKTRLQAQLNQADERLKTAIEKGGGSRGSEELNREVRGQLIEVEEAAENAASDLFKQVDRGGEILVDTGRIADAADDIIKSTPKAQAESIPAIARQLQRKTAEEGAELFGAAENVSEIMGLRSRLTTEIRREFAQGAPDRPLIARLEKLKRAVDEAILNDATDPQVGDAYQKAREFFRTEVAETFRQGTPARVLQRGRRGEPSAVPESATISQFFKKGRGASEAAKAFNRTLGKNAKARQALQESAVQDFAAVSVNPDGTFNRANAGRWVAQHREALNQFPEIKQRVFKILKKGEVSSEIKDKLNQTVQSFERSSARFFLDAEPDKAVAGIFRSKNPVAELTDAVNKVGRSKEAIRGLRRAIFDHGIRAAEIGAQDETIAARFLSPIKLRTFFTQNKKRFLDSGLYSKAELEQVDKIIRVSEVVNRSTGSGLVGGSDTAASLQAVMDTNAFDLIGRVAGARAGRIFGTIQSAGIGAQRGRGIARRIGDLLFSKEKRALLLEQALFDPEVARDLLIRVTDDNKGVVTRRLRAHLANLGSVALEAREGKEGDQEP